MSTTTTSTAGQRLAAWLTPTWIESDDGFPRHSVGDDPGFHSPTVVATSSGLALTEAVVLQSIAFAEFLAGHAFTPDERQQVADDVVGDFRRPGRAQASLRDLLEVSVAVRTIPGLSPIVRARLRHQALTRIMCDQRRSGRPASAAVDLVCRYNPVLVVDLDEPLVVTDDAVLAWRRLRQLIADTAGLPLGWNEAAFRAEVEESFDTWPARRRSDLAQAHPNLVSLLVGLRHLDPPQLADLAETVAEQTRSAGTLEVAAAGLGQVARVNDLVAAIRRRLADAGGDAETVARQLDPAGRPAPQPAG